MSDRVAVMRDGGIEQVGSPDELYEFPVNQFVADFLGESNFVPGVWRDTPGAGGGLALETEGGMLVRVPAAGPGVAAGTPGLLAIRPEKLHLQLDDGPAPVSAGQQAAPGMVAEVVYSGATTQYRVAVPGAGTWLVAAQNRGPAPRAQAGQRVTVAWASADLRILAR